MKNWNVDNNHICHGLMIHKRYNRKNREWQNGAGFIYNSLSKHSHTYLSGFWLVTRWLLSGPSQKSKTQVKVPMVQLRLSASHWRFSPS